MDISIRLRKSEVRNEVMTLISHLADMRGVTADDYLRSVTGFETDAAWAALLADGSVAEVVGVIPAVTGFDITDACYVVDVRPCGDKKISGNALKRLLLIYITERLSYRWLAAAGWPYDRSGAELSQESWEAITGVSAVPTRCRERRMTPF